LGGEQAGEEAGDVADFLQRLEHADDGVRTYHAKISYTKVHKMIGDEISRGGELRYRVGEAGRTFAVVFDTLDADGQRNEIDERLIFDGRFLVEKNEAQKMYTRRELAPAGERIDPLQLGEGPIPIPIGQKAEEMERRYDAELLRFDAGAVGAARSELLADTVQLRLVPKAAFQNESEFTEIRLWYREPSLRPRLAYTVSRSGDESFVVLINAKVNDDSFDASLLEIEPPDDPSWNVQEIPGRFEARADGAAK
jgi:hypothetical protein